MVYGVRGKSHLGWNEADFGTGCSGFLGNYLWKHYSANGWKLVGTSYATSNERFLKFDIADRASFEDLLRAVTPEVVINASGYINGIAEQAAGIKTLSRDNLSVK